LFFRRKDKKAGDGEEADKAFHDNDGASFTEL